MQSTNDEFILKFDSTLIANSTCTEISSTQIIDILRELFDKYRAQSQLPPPDSEVGA